MQPIEQACYWMATRESTPAAPLEGEREADFAIVGAGFTGLWTALFLKEREPSAEVVLVERETVAYGGSGRNAGMLSETIDHSHDLAVRHFGLAEARRLARLGQENINEMAALLVARGIACEWEPVGRLVMALMDHHLVEARRAVETARRLGVDTYRLLDAGEARRQIDSPLYLGGIAIAAGGNLNPVRLADGLRREAERLGVMVHEHSPVSRLEVRRAGILLHTPGGRLTARKAVLATNAWSHHLLPRLAARFIPLYDYILVSDPLTADQRSRIGWRGRQGVTDGRTFFNYYRLTADNRVLWGTSEAAYYGRNRVAPAFDHSAAHYAALRASFRRHFPSLAEVEFPFAWGGPICSTTRLTPFFGAAHRGRVLYGLGYTGHGLGTTRLAGRILADLALGRPSPLDDLALVRRKPIPYPPEPLRSWAVAAVSRDLRRVDEGFRPSILLRALEALGIGFSS